MLKGKKIILGISGGIAAYKSLILIRLFKKAGAHVRVVATANAMEFVTRVSLESLSQNKVYDQVFSNDNDYTTEHISLTDWADIMVVAPATANIVGKFANGIADDALSTTFMAFNQKVFVAPAMNCKMYEHFAFQRNLEYLKTHGICIIEPAEGFLACGYEGKGRMEEPEQIFEAVKAFWHTQKDFQERKVLITAGPTYEAIDPVRFIGNHSSGKMGIAMAIELAQRNAKVILVCGPVSLTAIHPNITRIDVVSAQQMYDVCTRHFPDCDAAILAAAVADYRPQHMMPEKIKKDNSPLSIPLVPNPDILATLGQMKRPHQVLAGFALETQQEEENARKKLQNKNLDFIVLNSLKDSGAGFGHDTNKITILDNKNQISRFDLKDKTGVAKDIADQLWKQMADNQSVGR